MLKKSVVWVLFLCINGYQSVGAMKAVIEERMIKTKEQRQQELDKKLFLAVEDDNVLHAKEAVNQGANINTVGSDGLTLLHIACLKDSNVCAQWLVEKGVSVRAKDVEGRTCLHFVCCHNNIELLEFLVKLSIDLDAKDLDEWTPLHWACWFGDTESAQLLIEQGANLFILNKTNESPWSFLSSNDKADLLDFLFPSDAGDKIGVFFKNVMTAYSLVLNNSVRSPVLAIEKKNALLNAQKEPRLEVKETLLSMVGKCLSLLYVGSKRFIDDLQAQERLGFCDLELSLGAKIGGYGGDGGNRGTLLPLLMHYNRSRAKSRYYFRKNLGTVCCGVIKGNAPRCALLDVKIFFASNKLFEKGA
ncbi:TPA: hypothetical protein DDZ86_05105 [Candidatus Dependentiae bacterium]|nr:MAG: hypothetical protein A2Y17_09910 [Clostridiales bacterium GWF2_38_85]HBL98990.1 hypothetical protein [Candidatus Dependentiae bacterium]